MERVSLITAFDNRRPDHSLEMIVCIPGNPYDNARLLDYSV